MTKKILLFDDNADILELCTIILKNAGYEVKSSQTSNNIEEQVLGFMPDLILMDNWIPDIGGIVATQNLKKNPILKHIPVIYFSANNDIESLAKLAGAEDYLTKPFDILKLERIVRKHTSD